MDGQKVWNSIISDIKSQIPSSTFKTWFSGTSVLDSKEDLLIISVKNSFLKEQIETRYRPIIADIAKRKGLDKTEVVFVVAKSETGSGRSSGPRQADGGREPLFSGIAQTFFGNHRKADSISPDHIFENFVIGSSNNLAYLAFSHVAESLGSLYNPLFVYGPTGVGKTHLLQACGNAVLSRTIDAKILYVSAEKFTNDYIESLNNRSQATFRQKYRNVDVLLVDDVQFFAGKESTQDEFFNTFNELYLSGRQIILACDRHPRELARLKDRLVSRFLGGMAVDIQKPDLELRVAIIRAKCKERGVELDAEIINYIAQSVQKEVRELEGVLIQVLLLSKMTAGKLSLDSVRASLEKSWKTENPAPTPGKIVEAVSRHFKIAGTDICGSRRKASLVYARQVLMYLLRQDLGLSLDGVGQIVGGRDHSTVLYGVDKIGKLIASDQGRRDEIARVRAIF